MAEAMYGGKPCDKEERSWTTTEPCKTDKKVLCAGGTFKNNNILQIMFLQQEVQAEEWSASFSLSSCSAASYLQLMSTPSTIKVEGEDTSQW